MDRHRRWVALLVVVNAVAGAVGPDYRTDFTLPSSETKDVQELLEANNPERAGFSSQIVVQAEQGVDDPAVAAALQAIMDFAAEQEGVTVTSPYDNPQQISQDGTIAFAQLDVERPQLRGGHRARQRRSRSSARSNRPSRACRSSTAVTCSASSSCPRARSSASSPPSSS